jgi:hypothetical protein
VNKNFQKVISSLVVAAIVADVGAMWNFNARMSRIETMISVIEQQLGISAQLKTQNQKLSTF